MKLPKPYPTPAGSWVITKTDGTLVETFDFHTAAQAASFGLKVVTISEHLADFNKSVRDELKKSEV